MRIDSPSSPPPAAVTISGGGDVTQLRRYLRAVRRRWPVLIAFCFVGALVGWVTTPNAKGAVVADQTFYQAVHTLLADSTTGGGEGTASASPTTVNLDQAAFLANKGEVPDRVAKKLGVSAGQVSANCMGQSLGGVSSIQITCVDPSADRAVMLSDTVAGELIQYLAETTKTRYETQRDAVQAKLDDLTKQRTDVVNQLAAHTGDATVLNAQLDSISNQYRITYEEFQLLASNGQPSAGLTTVQAATPLAITRAQYNALHAQIQNGPDPSGATPSTTTPPKSSPSAGKPASAPLRGMAGGFLGLILGVITALVLDRYDTRLRQREEVESVTGLPVLAEIPPLSSKQQHDVEVVAFTNRRSRTAEAYRVVRSALIFAHAAAVAELGESAGADSPAVTGNGAGGNGLTPPNGGLPRRESVTDAGPAKEGQVVMVTSPGPGEGKTTTVSNLAAVLAEGGLSVLVLNCDFRRPRVQKYLIDEPDGASESDPMGIIAATGQVKAVATKMPHVRLVTGIGEGDLDANPIEIVGVQKRLIAFARQHYDVVLLDTAPFLTTNDASELLADSDVVLLVIRCGKTRREAARRTSELLFRLEAPLLGTVFTDSADAPSAEYYYHYYLDETPTKGRGPFASRATPEPAGEPVEGSRT